MKMDWITDLSNTPGTNEYGDSDRCLVSVRETLPQGTVAHVVDARYCVEPGDPSLPGWWFNNQTSDVIEGDVYAWAPWPEPANAAGNK